MREPVRRFSVMDHLSSKNKRISIQQLKFRSDVDVLFKEYKENLKSTFNNSKLLENSSIENFKCIICYQLLIDPVECSKSQCSELLCKECWSKCFMTSPRCPNCREYSSFNKPGRKIRKLLDEIKLHCQNENCTLNKKEITYQELITHSMVCPKQYLKCPLECEYIGNPDKEYQFKSHFNNCVNALTECKFCHL